MKSLIGLAVCAIIVLAGKFLSRRLAFSHRKPMSLDDIYQTIASEYRITYDTFVNVFRALGDNYSIDPRLIRPEDSLKKLFDVDSWDLGERTLKMEKWLLSTFDIPEGGRDLKTVLDLLMILEGRQKCGPPTQDPGRSGNNGPARGPVD